MALLLGPIEGEPFLASFEQEALSELQQEMLDAVDDRTA
jgi:hypothetical protein